ncbi:MAG: hypothetical protein O7D91_21550 [Planctomycetota bacterium]|nr:hypothetical protein [Planctomycetota bacterium]
MKAYKELQDLTEKLAAGTLPDDEPLFTLRAEDCMSAGLVRVWCIMARKIGVPTEKILEAESLAQQMEEWSLKKVPDDRIETDCHR